MTRAWLRVAAVLALAALAALPACNRKASQATSIACFDATTRDTSAAARAVFAERHCQGGGVTWAGLINVLVQRRGSVAPVLEATPGWTGGVSTLNGRARFSIDDEADSARFCTDDAELLADVRQDYERLEADQAFLRKAMSEAPPLALECLDVDGGISALLDLVPLPGLPPDQARTVGASVVRLRETIRKQPAWCFPGGQAFDGSTGALRFTPDDRVVYTPSKGAAPREGTVTWPRDGSGDDRVQITEPTLLHLDVSDSDAGRPGRSYFGKDGGLVREELIPGDGCLR